VAAAQPQIVTVLDHVPVQSREVVPVPARALISDSTLLILGIGLYVVIMIEANRLYARWQTPAEAAALAGGWLLLILMYGGYDRRYVGVGTEEFKRVLSASVALLAAVSAAAYVFLPESPPLRLVIPSIVVGSVLLIFDRWLLRVWLGRQRVKGRFQCAALVIGDMQRSNLLLRAFQDDPPAGYVVVAQVAPPHAASSSDELDHWLDHVTDWVDSQQIGAVAVADSSTLDPGLLKKLAWRLEGPRVDLLVSPLLYDVAGPRVSVRPASGLPLLHLDEPELTGPKRFAKRAMDLAIAIPAVILISPLLLLIAISIRWGSRGPALYVSERVGRAGRTFGCLKFRTMRVGADSEREVVIGAPDDHIAERYRSDPRITRVGHWLRRWSLDELPQLLNVIGGSMSLVGPRPVLPEELDLLADTDLRRHITKPGLTGLWQVSGRKEVAWEDRMRMDLYYVEHWSLLLDCVILAKTAKAVLAGRGAY
jgi:exopolysaccharide biosynthesis polyprenyl glycosylphosphotransferase